MLAFGKEKVLKKDQIVTVANYVRSLSGLPTAAGYDAAAGGKFSPITARRATAIAAKGNRNSARPISPARSGSMARTKRR